MRFQLNKILDTESLIKNFQSIKLSQNELIYLKEQVKIRSNIHFINWHDNIKLINEHLEIKNEIQQQLIQNMLNHADNLLVIDLTQCQIDEHFLENFFKAIENNRVLGGVILDEETKELFKDNQMYKNIIEHLQKNNENYKEFPSDYIYALLTCHCNHDKDEELLSKLESLGWKIEQELTNSDDDSKNYISILYKNESTRQLVLAFRGLQIKLFDWFNAENKLEDAFYSFIGNEVGVHSSYAYLHSKAAFELSEKLNYSLSFTGHSFGAWLAEQSVYFCFEESRSRDVRAVTFDSPGSWDIIQNLAKTNISNTTSLSGEELAKHLDIKTYLFSPSFINTSNEHVGQVYRLFEVRPSVVDEFVTDNILEIIPSEKRILKTKFENWYLNKLEPNFEKYLFYLNGMVTLFSRDLKWLIEEFDETSENFKGQIKKVTRWPKMQIKQINKRFENLNLIDKLVSIEPFVGDRIPEFIRKLITKPIDLILNKGIKSIVNNSFYTISMIFNIVADFLSGNIIDEQCLECFEFDQEKESIKTKIIDSSDFQLVFKNRYRLKKVSLHSEQLWLLDPTYNDSRLLDYFNDFSGNYLEKECPMSSQFAELKTTFKIVTIPNEITRSIMHTNEITIERIKERFSRLKKVNEAYNSKDGWKKIKNQLKNSEGYVDDFGGNKNPIFVETEPNIFQKIDNMLDKNHCVYIYGASGFGKTTLAREYAYYKQEKDFCVQLVVSGDLRTNILEIKRRFIQDTYSQKWDITDLNQLLNLISQTIKEKEKDSLLIFDDVKKLEDIELILETLDKTLALDQTLELDKILGLGKAVKSHKFLITTNNKDLFKSKGNNYINLNKCDENLFNNYLNKCNILTTKQNEKSMTEFIKRCVESNVSIKDFDNGIKYLLSHPQITLDEVESYIKNESHSKYTTLLKENKPCFNLLKHLTYLDGNFISQEILKSIFRKPLTDSLDYLMRNGFIKRRYDASSNEVNFEIHEKTQEELKEYLKTKETEKEKIIKHITECLNKRLDRKRKKLAEEKRLLESISRHVKKLSTENWDKPNDENYLELLKNMVEISKDILSHFGAAIDFLNEQLMVYKEAKESKQEDLAMVYKNMGLIYFQEGKYEEALSCFKKDLEIQRLLKNELKEAESLIDIGHVHFEQENFDESKKCFEKALKIQKKNLPNNHPDIAATIKDIGLVNFWLEKLNEALNNFMEALEILKQNYESNLSEIADLYKNIGHIYKIMGENKKSLDYCKKSLDILKTLPYQGELAAVMTIISEVYTLEEDYESSRIFYSAVLEIQNIVLPYYHPDRVATLNALAFVCAREENYEVSRKYAREAMQTCTLTLPTIHPEMARYLNNTGTVYFKGDFYEDALEYHMKALEIQRKCLPPDHHDIAETINNIGLVKNRLKMFQEAIKHFQESFDIRNKLPVITGALRRGRQPIVFTDQNPRARKEKEPLSLPEITKITTKKKEKTEKTEEYKRKNQMQQAGVAISISDTLDDEPLNQKHTYFMTGSSNDENYRRKETREKTENTFFANSDDIQNAFNEFSDIKGNKEKYQTSKESEERNKETKVKKISGSSNNMAFQGIETIISETYKKVSETNTIEREKYSNNPLFT